MGVSLKEHQAPTTGSATSRKSPGALATGMYLPLLPKAEPLTPAAARAP